MEGKRAQRVCIRILLKLLIELLLDIFDMGDPRPGYATWKQCIKPLEAQEDKHERRYPPECERPPSPLHYPHWLKPVKDRGYCDDEDIASRAVINILRPHLHRCRNIEFNTVLGTSLPSPSRDLSALLPTIESLILKDKFDNEHPYEILCGEDRGPIQEPAEQIVPYLLKALTLMVPHHIFWGRENVVLDDIDVLYWQVGTLKKRFCIQGVATLTLTKPEDETVFNLLNYVYFSDASVLAITRCHIPDDARRFGYVEQLH
ncbi:hypothetical protein NLJ89_g5864 [Agrocybe chaxingu]|uniref:Uncharacterized protein n=1 Tax=Agrocybe chaxingu TaxID=84603 RepID=A0A9W8JZS8_9AGAR|nr:hypothetical protein NLJ89_g5864 [Agrocybe chaxingu]